MNSIFYSINSKRGLDDNMVNENMLRKYPKKNIDIEIYSMISKVIDIIYLKEDLGWVDKRNNPVNIGSWDSENRIATLDNKLDQSRKLFVIDVNNATIDGAGSIIGGVEVAINIIGQHDINFKNFIIKNNNVAIFMEASKGISIEYSSFIDNKDSIVVLRSNEIKIKSNVIESTPNTSTGIFIQNSGNVVVENNTINIKISKNDNHTFTDSYYGINTEGAASISILNNNIEIKDSIIESVNSISAIITGYCINFYSTYDTIIKSNNLCINKNNITLNSSNVAEINLAVISLNNNNTSIEVEENNITINSNDFKVACNNGGIKNDVMLYTSENNSNKITNNLISINNNSYNINSNTSNNHYIDLNAIRMEYYNNYNSIVENEINVIENKAIFESDTCKAINYLCGLYLNTENITNNIVNNNILVKANDITSNSNIETIYALVYLYNNNVCNTIMENNLNESQGNGIVLVNSNDNTEIIENSIKMNSIYGILLTNENINTNISIIMNNCIEGNGDYGIYIIRGNYYNIIKNNNFISYEAKNIYDNNTPEFKNYYERNYYNDWNNIRPYVIEGSNFEDNFSEKLPINLKCN